MGELYVDNNKNMTIDTSNLVSGIIGGIIALAGAFAIAYIQHRWTAKENENQRADDRRLQYDQKKHERHLQVRGKNIDDNGFSSLSDVGGG
jgi:hypothetical protein